LKDGKPRIFYDRDLLAASQLPWFRQGWMPDWLRTALQLTLSPAQTQNIRRELLLAMGFRAGNTKPEANLEIDFGKSDIRGEKRHKADRILAEFILPSFYSSRRLFSVPPKVAANIARRPLRNLTIVSVIGAFGALFFSFVALSVVPIDECDLFAASRFDPLRVGAPVEALFLSNRLPSYADKVEVACKAAMLRHPENPRFKYQYTKAIWNRRPAESFQINFENVDYPASYDSIGDHYLLGHGTNQDYAKAEASYLKAVALGVNASNFGLMSLYNRKDYSRRDIREACKFAELATESGIGFDFLAKCYRDGGPIKPNPEKYIQLLKRGIRYRDSKAAQMLASEYLSGYSVPYDVKRANELNELATLWSADPSSALELGISNYAGRGIPANYEKATFWFIFSAKLDQEYALIELSDMIVRGDARYVDGQAPTIPKLTFARIAGEGGKSDAQYYLATELEKLGQNDEETKFEAISWYRKAAAAGFAPAEESLKRLGIENDAKSDR
jgi:TPR repeat protein